METERPLTIAQIAASVPDASGRGNVRPSTVVRWILRGCNSADGHRVKLRAHRMGYRWYVYSADLAEFFKALTGSVESSLRSPTERNRESEKAEKELIAAGA